MQQFVSNHAGSVLWLYLPIIYGNSWRDELYKGTQTHPPYLISSTISTLLPVHIYMYIESKGCFITAKRMSNCETGQSSRLSNSIYPLQQGELEPSSQKICYLLETNSIFHLARSEEMNTKDSAGCWSWLVQKENSQKHIPKQSRERVM